MAVGGAVVGGSTGAGGVRGVRVVVGGWGVG